MTSDTSVSPTPADPLSVTPEPPLENSVEAPVVSPDLPPSEETPQADTPKNDPSEPTETPVIAIEDLQVRLKAKDGELYLTLPPESESSKVALAWGELWQQFKQLLMGRERFWQPNTLVHLMSDDRLLDTRQISAIAEALAEVQLQLKWVHTRRRQTAVVAATAGYSVEQITASSPLLQNSEQVRAMEEPLYIQMTLRSGAEIRHNGTVVVVGDVNPGSSIIAEGDILVWGRLRGVAHAGCKGNAKCLIMSMQMEPTQIRIADYVARAPETPLAQYVPEVAYVSPQGSIRIARAADFASRKEESNFS
ncbi:MAG: septum site-determining protein MinC [Leptolyngbya sp. Prado105]|jgi:septum site-determining protein MinC|nr:septum site-determining protein MinC [Leptolyngbya sp. Prado105]